MCRHISLLNAKGLRCSASGTATYITEAVYIIAFDSDRAGDYLFKVVVFEG